MSEDIQVFHEISAGHAELGEHHHNSFELVYIMSGSARFGIGSRHYLAGSNTFVFISHLEPHTVTATSFPYERRYILISPSCLHKYISDPVLKSVFTQRPEGFRHAVEHSPEHSEKYITLFNMMSADLPDQPYRTESVLSALTLLLICLFRDCPSAFPMNAENRQAALVSEVQKYVEENYTGDISLKSVSEAHYISMHYLSRLFRTHSGFSFSRYLILRKLSKAKELLAASNDSISLVSEKSGFGNVNHFIRTFRSEEGMTPLKYRKRQRKDKTKI